MDVDSRIIHAEYIIASYKLLEFIKSKDSFTIL